MASRYDSRDILINDSKQNLDTFKKRGVNFIRQYNSPVFRYPSSDEIKDLESIGYTWGLGDRYYKLAHEYYGDPELWWVIAFMAQKPTEFHIKTGETIYIYFPLERVMDLMGV